MDLSRQAAMKAKILIIGDDFVSGGSLHRALVAEGFNVSTANDGRAAIERVQSRRPDVVILDAALPGMDGLEVCRCLRTEGHTAILALTARDVVADRILALESGADDCLARPFAIEELLARVRALLRRHTLPPREVLAFGDLTLDVANRRASRGKRTIELSTTEFELLALFMYCPDQVLPRQFIMERIWGHDSEGESNVLEVYISYLRSKLEAGGEQRLIQTVRGAGLR